MRIYWSYRSIPDLAPLPRQEQDQLWRAHCYTYLRYWQGWLFAFLPMFALIVIGSHLFGFWGELAAGGVGGFLMSQVSIFYARPAFRKALQNERPESAAV